MAGPVKKSDGMWHVEVRPWGAAGKRFRKKFALKTEANQFYQWCLNQASDNKDWVPSKPKADDRTLHHLALKWHELHGHTLKDGDKRLSKLQYLIAGLGNPLADSFTASDFLQYRNISLKPRDIDGKKKPALKENTLNHHLTYLKSMFNKLIEYDEWEKANPLEKVKPLKFDDAEVVYLQAEEITELLEICRESTNDSLLKVASLCLATGARWSEAEKLNAQQVKKGFVTYSKTKNGKSRMVPISEKIHQLITDGSVKRGRLFEDCYNAFGYALEKSTIILPEGQKTHVLRHSFASHYMINGGDILKLNKALGHATLQQTMRYAHFSPNHLDDVIEKNPMA